MNDVKSCLLVGVGGQGAILISKIMSNGFMKAGYDVKQSEVHGMAQRGGSVSTQVRWGKKVYGPVFGKGEADIMVALEKMEAVRYAEFLNPNGVAVINDYAIKSTTIASGAEEYPQGCIEAMQKNFKTIAVPASDIAIQLGNPKCMNVVLFGAMCDSLGCPDIDWEQIVAETVPAKVKELNLKAFRAGREAAMVEEERTQIGTMKALGYSKVDIAAKYLLYALFATVGGSVLGVLAGEKILPYIIIRSYGIMYLHMNTICIPYNMKFALIAAGAAIFCTMIATLEACIRELHAWPAVLMRPPAPKQGRRVWIEKIPFLWKHLSFTWKSTVRNLFRYKKRFFMTIIGIGGCMGLLLVGFGLRDSIMDVAILQYQDIQVYDGMIVLDADADQSGQDELKQELADDGSVEAFAEVSMKKVEFASADKKLDVYLMVVPDDVSIDEFVKFRSRTTKEAYELDDQGMILTEKAGKLLGVSAGDSVEMTGEHSGVKIPINRICENYMSHFAYMTENMYRKLYGEKPQYNSILYRVTDRDESIAEKAGERAMKCDAALSVTYTGNTKEQLDNMLTALDSVIGVLILSAGMLAFVVLYNLNNININERKRELATIKVLGFYDKEVSAYVYRENILLTILGSIFGIFLGILLHRFIIVTVEVDVCMFGRNISVFSYVISALITYGFSILVNGVMYFKLKKIDMVESLKSVE